MGAANAAPIPQGGRTMRARLFGAGVALLFIATTGPLQAANRDLSLVEAAKAGDTKAVRELLRRNANPNDAEVDGTTALHWAVERDDPAMVDALLKAGANAKAANRYGVAPLSAAAENGNGAIVE